MTTDWKAKLLSSNDIKKHCLPPNGVWFWDQKHLEAFKVGDEGSNHPEAFSWDNKTSTRKNSKIFGAFKTKEDFMTGLLALPPNNRHGYEHLQEGRRVLLYADIEWQVAVNDSAKIDQEIKKASVEGDAKMMEWMRLHRQEMEKLCGLKPSYIVLFCGPRLDKKLGKDDKIKISYHVIIQNLYVVYDVCGRKLMKRLMSLPQSPIEVDPAVYNMNQKFRTIHSCKGSDETCTPFKISSTLNSEPHSISDSMTILQCVPPTAINLQTLFDRPELAKICAELESTIQRPNTQPNASQKLEGRRDKLSGGDVSSSEQLIATFQKILKLTGDNTSRLSSLTETDQGFRMQGTMTSGCGRHCPINPLVFHNSNNFRIFLNLQESIDHGGVTTKLYSVVYSCFSEQCRSPSTGRYRIGQIGRVTHCEAEGYKIIDFKAALWNTQRFLVILDNSYECSGEINSSKAKKDLEKELSLDKDALRGLEDSIEEWIQLWVDGKNLNCPSDQMDIEDSADNSQSTHMEVDHSSSLLICDAASDQSRKSGICSQGGLTQEQKDRMAQNREAALVIKRKLEAESGSVGGDKPCDCKETIADDDSSGGSVGDGGCDDDSYGVSVGVSDGGCDHHDSDGGCVVDGSCVDQSKKCGFNSKTVEYILENIDQSRFEDENDLRVLYQICISENQVDSLIRQFKKAEIFYQVLHERHLNESIPRKGLTLDVLIHWLRKDNSKAYATLVPGLAHAFKSETVNHKDMAALYYNANPDQYLYSKEAGWFVFNSFNVLEGYKKENPPALLHDISEKLQRYIDELIACKRKEVKYDDSEDDKVSKKQLENLKKAYKSVSSAPFVKSIIEYLKELYSVKNLLDKMDSNSNLLAFDNMGFDLELGRLRPILPSDYVTKTTKYPISTRRNGKIAEEILELLRTIWENDNISNFWLTTTALSMFGKSFESLYIHTGGGRNGKGVISTLLKAMLGDYFLTTDNTFLTTQFRSGQPNPVLANSKGARFLLVTEPDNGSPDCSLNLDFVKYMTGGDMVTARDLYVSNISFIPFFTLTLQCNAMPRLVKVDKAIEERLKVINYPLTFVDQPQMPNERKKNNRLKEEVMKPSFINEFILMLCDIAFQNKNMDSIVLPDEIKNQNKDYIEENNTVSHFIRDFYVVTKDSSDKVKSSEILVRYNLQNTQKLSADKLKAMMEYNGIKLAKKKDENYYVGLKEKPVH